MAFSFFNFFMPYYWRKSCSILTEFLASNKMGFGGSANAIYQYILKKRHEESITNTDRISVTEQNTIPSTHPPRPKRVSLQRVAKGSIYKYVLHEASVERKTTENESADMDINPKRDLSEPEVTPETATPNTETFVDTSISTPASDQPRSAFYSDEIADILIRPKTQDDKESKKKTSL